MSRYIVATPAVRLEPAPGEKEGKIVTWVECIRALFTDMRLQKEIQTFDLIDLRKNLLELKVGDPALKITDAEGKSLEDVCKKIEVFIPIFIHADGAEQFFRTFTDAPTKNPLNGAAVEEATIPAS